MTTDQDPAALAREAIELADQATPGPWMYDVGEMQWLPSPSKRYDATEGRKGWVGEASNHFDGAFVAHAGTHYATLARAVLALTEERDALRAALSELYATRSVAADIEDGMNVVRCTDAEWDAHVAACRKARAALRGKEGT